MDKIRWKRLNFSSQNQSGGSLPNIDTAVASISVTSSPAISIDSSKGDFFQSIVPKAIRSLSRGSTPRSPNPESPSYPPSARKVLQKSNSRAFAYDSIGRRGSTSSEGYGRISKASTTISGGSVNSFDWRSQPVESHLSLEPDPQLLRNKAGYLIITSDYVVVLKNKADATAAFPQLATGTARSAHLVPEPLHVIPLHLIVAVFHAESSRPSFGIDVWWRSSYPVISFCSTQLFFNLPEERRDQMKCILRMVKSKTKELPDISRAAFKVEDCIKKIFRAEEPRYSASKPEIFPVVERRSLPREGNSKADDKTKKESDGASLYLVIGINLCFLVEIAKASAVQDAPLEVKYQSFGLVTLEALHGHWFPHEERFLIKFRDPFKRAITLELASRYYKHIFLTLMKADKYLKPAWPTFWQTTEIFRVAQLPEPQHVIAGEDFGGFQRTLTAFAAAYRCQPVDWEINWKTQLAPEFRVIPPKSGSSYSAVQLLAVFRALRYNDYFMSLSFRGVDLGSIWGKYDSDRKGNVAYMNRSCVCLNTDECFMVQKGSVLHQEFHALGFSSQTIRQIDFTNCLKTYPNGCLQANHDVQFLSPILDLLRAGLSRCNRLILRGCALGQEDMRELVEALTPELPGHGGDFLSPPRPAIRLEALDISQCRLPDSSLRSLFKVLLNTGGSLQVLDVSGNPGRVSAPLASLFIRSLADMKRLNMAEIIIDTVEGALLPSETLVQLDQLEELNISNFKLNIASQQAIADYLLQLSTRKSSQRDHDGGCALRHLALNNCGIDGRGAGRMFNAMTGLTNIHLSLNGNPLENEIDQLTKTISLCWNGQFGLHMDMVEFKDETNYMTLIKALTINKHITFLSMVGTGPTPTAEATCSEQLCHVLEQFLAKNKSIRYLDLSGYSGKLDEGQLGRGFGRCLKGLAQNKTLTHLRVRNQNLNDDIGTLGTAIQQNGSIRFLDCEDNDFNLTSLRYLVGSLRENGNIMDFRFNEKEKTQIVKRCLEDIPLPKTRKKDSSLDPMFEAQKAMLEAEVEKSILQIRAYISRNRAGVERITGQFKDFGDSAETGGNGGWPSLELKVPEGATPTDAAEAAAQERSTVWSCSVGPDTATQTPYHVQQDDGALNSPTDAASPSSDVPTTPELVDQLESPATDGEEAGRALNMGGDFEKMWGHFKLSGLESEV